VVTNRFELICEVEPATQPDLIRVRHQIGVLSPIASAFLVPDNHIGRATVSSIAVANEVARMGGRAIACLNARDRNVLGFRRDLLTAAAYGVDELLFVYGDRPESGRRSDDLTVRKMISAARRFDGEHAGFGAFRIGVTSRLVPLPSWKSDADFIMAQVGHDVRQFVAWRESIDVRCPVYAGVIVVTSAQMARKLTTMIPQLAIPSGVVELVERDSDAGVEIACDLVQSIRATNVFDGVHLIPLGRYREVAHRLEQLLAD
jgi:methylenetetrahydrofolate reductase (NADPH)